MIRPANNALAVAGVVVLFCLLVLGSIGLKVWQESTGPRATRRE